MDKKNLDWKLSAEWLTPKKRRRKCVNVLQFLRCEDHFNKSANQLRCKSRFNQSATRKHPSGWLIGQKSYSRCLSVTKLVQWYALSDRALFLHIFYHSAAFKNFNERAITKGLRRCHNAPCIVNDGWPKFPSSFCFWAEIRRLWFFNVKAKEFLIQVFIHGPDQGWPAHLVGPRSVNCAHKACDISKRQNFKIGQCHYYAKFSSQINYYTSSWFFFCWSKLNFHNDVWDAPSRAIQL